jgi:thiol-disulfide isomerase/thioredoxin
MDSGSVAHAWAQPGGQHPFPDAIQAPTLEGGLEWINTSGPLDTKDLRGKFVLLDFWTYCCINCMHILPELKKLEEKYPNELVVIGVHSAKFETEKDAQNIRDAVQRYEIEHPVVNDANHVLWDKFQVQSWPSLRVIDPEGKIIAGNSGEISFEALDAFMQKALPYYRNKKVLDPTPLKFDLEASKAKKTPLRYPGKVLADEAGGRLFIADSNHHRIVVAGLDGKLLDVIGSGVSGTTDGDFATAKFNLPQGMVLHGDDLYIADTSNHLLRKVNLQSKQVQTIAGTGSQATSGFPGFGTEGGIPRSRRWVGLPSKTALNSPWDLYIHEDSLYIAMAGPHQIWKMPLDESEIGPVAGNGREDIVDGPQMTLVPYQEGYASFAQPSGLTSDGKVLYVADSEGSSIRAVPFDVKKPVFTIVGTSRMPFARLFLFGDRDGSGLVKAKGGSRFRGEARDTQGVLLQHALGIVYHDGLLYVADTYNNKIKSIDPESQSAKTIAGTGKPGTSDDPAEFDEPAGITFAAGKLYVADTNAHSIRIIDLQHDNKVSTFVVEGLEPPSAVKPMLAQKPTFPRAKQVDLEPRRVNASDGKVRIDVTLKLPVGWKINPLAPQRYFVETTDKTGPLDRKELGQLVKVDPPSKEIAIELPITENKGSETLKISMDYYYCQDKNEGLCKTGSVAFTLSFSLDDNASETKIEIPYEVK